jgi:hypothetical protein
MIQELITSSISTDDEFYAVSPLTKSNSKSFHYLVSSYLTE